MEKAWTPPRRWVFGVATVLGVFSALQAYRLTALGPWPADDTYFAQLLVLNLVYWYIPAALTPAIFGLAHRFHTDSPRWLRTVAVHVAAAATYSLLHAAGMMAMRAVLFDSAGKMPSVPWGTYFQRLYLTNLDWTLMTYTTILGFSYMLRYYRESQTRAVKAAQLETQLVEARLRTLEAELHPHFLFNTLHAISALLHRDPDSADRMISRLSDLLRITFDRSGAARIPLHEELEFLQKYLEIEQTRFQDRLSVQLDVEPETLDAEVPRMILQPIVENAIKHGVSARSGPGVIRIAARRDEGRLRLQVVDNGAGIESAAKARGDSGIGLSNTRDRLQCIYGSRHRLELANSAEGVTVTIEVPFSRVAAGDGSAPAFRVA